MKKLLNYLVNKINSPFMLFYFIVSISILFPAIVAGILYGIGINELTFWPFGLWFIFATSIFTYAFKKNQHLK